MHLSSLTTRCHQNKTRWLLSFCVLHSWNVSLAWVIAEVLTKGAKRSCTNQRSCLSLSRAQRKLPAGVVTISVPFAYSFFRLYFALLVQYSLHSIGPCEWSITRAIYCTPKCLVEWELKPCYCNHLNPLLADRNIHSDPAIIDYRTGCTGRFLLSATCSLKLYSLHAVSKHTRP